MSGALATSAIATLLIVPRRSKKPPLRALGGRARASIQLLLSQSDADQATASLPLSDMGRSGGRAVGSTEQSPRSSYAEQEGSKTDEFSGPLSSTTLSPKLATPGWGTSSPSSLEEGAMRSE